MLKLQFDVISDEDYFIEKEDFIKFFSEVFLSSEEKRKLFIKFITNKATVKDKKIIIENIYNNEIFEKKIKEKLPDGNGELIYKVLLSDTKLKAERGDALPDNTNIDILSVLFNMMRAFNLTDHSNIQGFNIVKDEFDKISNKILQDGRSIISNYIKVTCLSENNNSPLMWSHYANKHYGFCLEFDFTRTMSFWQNRYNDYIVSQIMLMPVIYTEKRPLFSKTFLDAKTMYEIMKTKKIPTPALANIIYGLLHKSEDWKYEKEWRIINTLKKETMKLPPPTKLFLGVNIEENAKARLIDIAIKKNIPVFQMHLTPDLYRFTYSEVNLIDYTNSNK